MLIFKYLNHNKALKISFQLRFGTVIGAIKYLLIFRNTAIFWE